MQNDPFGYTKVDGYLVEHPENGKWLKKNPDYWDQPWEIEAHGREIGLFIRWAEKEGYSKRKWVKDA